MGYHVKSCAICLEAFADTSQMKTRLLCCGHTFHSNCIDSWDVKESRGTCPFCRQPMQPASSILSASVPLQRSVAAPSSYSGFEEEYRFRIRRAQTLYPDYISQNMADSMQQVRILRCSFDSAAHVHSGIYRRVAYSLRV